MTYFLALAAAVGITTAIVLRVTNMFDTKTAAAIGALLVIIFAAGSLAA